MGSLVPAAYVVMAVSVEGVDVVGSVSGFVRSVDLGVGGGAVGVKDRFGRLFLTLLGLIPFFPVF
jgi:hypothetical protein